MFPAPIESRGTGVQISYRVGVWIALLLWLAGSF